MKKSNSDKREHPWNGSNKRHTMSKRLKDDIMTNDYHFVERLDEYRKQIKQLRKDISECVKPVKRMSKRQFDKFMNDMYKLDDDDKPLRSYGIGIQL